MDHISSVFSFKAVNVALEHIRYQFFTLINRIICKLRSAQVWVVAKNCFSILLPKKSDHFWSQCSNRSRQDEISAANLRDKYLFNHSPNSLCRNVHLKWNCKGLLHLADPAKMVFLCSSCHLPCSAGRCELYPGHQGPARAERFYGSKQNIRGLEISALTVLEEAQQQSTN